MDGFLIGASRSDPDDCLNTIELIKLIGIDTDGRHPHTGRHHRYRFSLIVSGIAVNIAHAADKHGVIQKCLGDPFGSERVTRHKHGFCDLSRLGTVMWRRHMNPSFFLCLQIGL